MHTRRTFIRNAGLASLGIGLIPGSYSPEFLFPEAAQLPRSSPELQGVSSEGILQFIEAANASSLGWHSFMLQRHGHIIAEGWWKPFAPAYTHTLYSLSKSFTSTAIGLLVKEGKLNINDPLISFFPDELPATISPELRAMTIRHLLTMNTGHAVDTMPPMRSNADAWTKTFLAQPVSFTPGTHFLYNTGASYMLGAVLYKITGQTLAAYLGPRLFQPLGIEGYNWETSPQGLNTAGYGLRVKTEDISKFGQLYLQNGKWNNKQLLSESWIKEATSYQTSSQEGNGDWSAGYGYQFWRCKPGFYRGDGAYGQFCIVMPGFDAVMSITSESWDMQKSMTTVWENILPAMHEKALPENKAAQEKLHATINKLVLPVQKGKSRPAPKKASYRLSTNEFGVDSIAFDFSPDACSLTLHQQGKNTTLSFGWENWITGAVSENYIFPVPGRIHVPSRMAGTAAWLTDKVLQLDARFVESIHGDTITCTFEDANISMTFLNSVAANSKTDPEKRKPLQGILA